MKRIELQQLIRECVREVLAETRSPGEVWKLKSGKWSSKSRGGRIGSFSDKKTAEKHARSNAKYGKSSAYKWINSTTKES